MQKKDEKSGCGFASSVFRGFILGLAVIFLMLSILALLISSGRAPESAARAGVFVTSFLSALAGSVLANKRYKSRALAVGASVGGALFVLTLIGSAFSEAGGVLGGITPALLLAFLAGGICGSFLCSRQKRRRRT